jgi:hypothetical protein
MAAVRATVFAVGRASTGTQTYWIVRRSQDAGRTWATVDQVPQAEATGIAVDRRGGAIYVLGRGTGSDATITRWYVRRSVDGGYTWDTVDQVSSPSATTAIYGTRIAVDDKGAISAVGYQGQPATGAILRRSEDGGATWTEIDFAGPMRFAQAVAAGPDGQVFVAGGQLPSPSSSFDWSVRESQDGKSGWTTVDTFTLSPSGDTESVPFGVSISRDGRVAVAGRALSDTPRFQGHWIVREATLANPLAWSTADDYAPHPPNLVGGASAGGVVYARDGELLATGFASSTTPNLPQIVTRRGTPPNPFSTSDALMEPAPSHAGELSPPDVFGAGAIARIDRGDVFTGNDFLDATGSRTHWLIRRLGCR